MTFSSKLVTTKYSMEIGNFTAGGGNFATIESLRTSVRVDAPGGNDGANATIAIYGMPLSQMNQLSTVGTQMGNIGANTIQVYVGDANSGMQLLFDGKIMFAWMDGLSQPQVCFRIEATPAAGINVKEIPPTSIQGGVSAAQIGAQLAGQAGVSFDGSAMTDMLQNPYLWGSCGMQIRQLAHMTGCEHIIDPLSTLAFWKPGQGRHSVGVVSPQTGMVGYPAYESVGILVKTLLRPDIVNGVTVTIQSQEAPANGEWVVTNVVHEAEANFPRGKWFTTFAAAPPGQGGNPSTGGGGV